MKTLQQLNELIVEEGDKIALVAMTKEKAESWTYHQLSQASEELAHGLIHEGLKKGERVAIIGEESSAWLIACLAIIRFGGICIPIDNQFSKKQLKQVLEDAKPSSAFVTRKIKERILSLKLKKTPELILLDGDKDEKQHWQQFKRKEKNAIEQVAPEDHAVIFFTSGTTGAPKGVPLNHKNLLHQLESLRRLKLVTRKDHLLVPLPFHHVYPFVIGILVPLYLGVRIILPHSLTSSQIKRALKEQDVTIVLGLPRLYRALLDGINNRIDTIIWPVRPCLKGLMRLSTLFLKTLRLRFGRVLLFPLHQQFSPKLRMLISGGSPLPFEIAMRLEGLGWKLLVGYGLTETSPLLTANTHLAKYGESVGKAIEGVSLRISKKKNEEIGEVEAKGPNVFEGYLEAPKKTKEAFTKDGWFRTGDRGKIDKEGFLYLAGRVSTLIVTESGENIQTEEIEDTYQEHPAIKEIGILERDGKLVAVIVPETSKVKDNIRDTLKKALEKIADDLPSYQHLTGFEISKSAIPRTRLQKIRRKELGALYDKLQKGDQKETAKPISIKEMSEEDQELLEDKAAKKIWEMLVKRYPKHTLSPESHFSLDLGVDSIDWLNLSLEIADCCQIEITEEHISQIETVRDLLKIITEESPEETGIKKEDILEKPESILDKKEQAWVSPLNPAMQFFARMGYTLNRFVFRFYFRLKVTGQMDFPEDKPCIIAPNHTSYLDPLALAAALDNRTLFKVRWAGLADIMLSNPIMRFISRLGRVVPIDTHRGAQSSLAFGAFILKKEESLIWFPEGGRSPDGKLQNFQSGIGMIAEHFKTVIIPVYIQGSYEALPLGGLWPRPHRIHIHFGKPQDPIDLEKKGDGKERYQRISDGLYKYMKHMSAQTKD